MTLRGWLGWVKRVKGEYGWMTVRRTESRTRIHPAPGMGSERARERSGFAST